MKKLFLIFALASFFSAPALGLAGPNEISGASRFYKVHRVLDGDTIVLSNEERVRMIGIDAPEVGNNPKLHRDAGRAGQKVSSIRAMGQLSRSFTAYLLEGKNVSLEFEGEKRDRKGRLLAHVFLPDGTHVNAEIIRQGFAVVTDMPSLKYREHFLKLQADAISHERGLWRKPISIEYQLRSANYSKMDETQKQNLLQKVDAFRAGTTQDTLAQEQIKSAGVIAQPTLESTLLQSTIASSTMVSPIPEEPQTDFYQYWIPEGEAPSVNY